MSYVIEGAIDIDFLEVLTLTATIYIDIEVRTIGSIIKSPLSLTNLSTLTLRKIK